MDLKGFVMNTWAMRETKEPPSNALDAVIGLSIQRVIQERKMLKREAAELSGIEGGYFSELINGKKRWNTENLLKVCEALKVEPFELMGGKPLSPEQMKKIQMMDDILALKAENVEIAEEIGLKRPGKKKPKA